MAAFDAAAVKLFGLCVGVSSELGFVWSSSEEVCAPPVALFAGLLFDDELDELLPIGFGWLLPLLAFCSDRCGFWFRVWCEFSRGSELGAFTHFGGFRERKVEKENRLVFGLSC